MCLEGAEEANADGVSAEQVVPAEAGVRGVRVPGGSEGGDGLCVGVEDVGWCGGEHGDAWTAGAAEEAGEGDRSCVATLQEDEPAARVSESVES